MNIVFQKVQFAPIPIESRHAARARHDNQHHPAANFLPLYTRKTVFAGEKLFKFFKKNA